jgi:hypothetical protein
MKASISLKRKMGRPRTGKELTVALTARVPAEVVRAIEAWARERDVTRSEAVTRLVELGLKAAPRKGKRP